MSEQLKWVGSDGPTVLAPLSHSKSWYGAAAPIDKLVEGEDYDEDDIEIMPDGVKAIPWTEYEPEDPTSHYEMACAYDEGAGLVEEHYLAIASTGEQVTWVPTEDGGIIARWVYADSEEDMQAALKDLDGVEWEELCEWTLEEDDAILMPAVDSVDSMEESVPVKLPSGTYIVSYGYYEEGSTAIGLVKLTQA